MVKFSKVTSLLKEAPGGYSYDVTEDWLYGRTAFGGLTAALCVASARQRFEDLPPLKSAQFSFLAPSSSALSLQPELLRRGRSSFFVGVDVASDGKPSVRASLYFANVRAGTSQNVVSPPTALLSPENSLPFRFEGNIPTYLAHFETRIGQGESALPEASHPEIVLWIRHRDPAVNDALLSLVSSIDALPAPAIFFVPDLTFVSTVTWSLDVVMSDIRTRNRWWLTRTKTEFTGGGFTSQTTTIWNRDAELVAVYRQMLAIFSRD